MSNLPKISVVIPTLNAANVVQACLYSISIQDYPKDKIEILIIDGGSNDRTLEIARGFGAHILMNKLKTAEAGKSVGVKNATGDMIALIDSDNILPDKKWLKEMVSPLLEEPEAVGSEPWKYTWRKEDGFITRYCALIGMNDPLIHFLGNYDRYNLLTGKWTEVERREEDRGAYLLVEFNPGKIPTIGANGTVFRAKFLKDSLIGDYLFDIDILSHCAEVSGSVQFIKVKNGIVHTYCERSVSKFAKKQRRRVRDYLFHKALGNRVYNWEAAGLSFGNSIRLFKFILYTVTFVPLVLQAVYGYSKKKDVAWFFHPLACLITLWEYGRGVIESRFKKGELDRNKWSQ